jgi:hypothetical protein
VKPKAMCGNGERGLKIEDEDEDGDEDGDRGWRLRWGWRLGGESDDEERVVEVDGKEVVGAGPGGSMAHALNTPSF